MMPTSHIRVMNFKTAFFQIFQIVLISTIFFNPLFGKIHKLKVPSVALKDSNRVIVATPKGYNPTLKGGYPFIVMLHGYDGDETQWAKDANLQELCDTYNVLLVLPDGGIDGWWVDTELLPGRNYETHIHQEIKIWMVKHFNGSIQSSQHGILGLSMGGFGAFLQALKFPESYAAAVSLSGVVDITRHPDNWHIVNALGAYSDNPENWKTNNPYHLLQKAAPKNSPDLLMICGRDDFTFAENQATEQQIKKYGYSGELQEEAGTHSHAFWKTHVPAAVDFIVENFKDD